MPYSFDTQKKKIPEEYDKRRKIPSGEHLHIKRRYKEGESLRQLARAYEVNKRTIQFILYPERRLQSMKNRDWRKYHNREKLTKAIRELRRRKAKLFNKKK